MLEQLSEHACACASFFAQVFLFFLTAVRSCSPEEGGTPREGTHRCQVHQDLHLEGGLKIGTLVEDLGAQKVLGHRKDVVLQVLQEDAAHATQEIGGLRRRSKKKKKERVRKKQTVASGSGARR